MPAEHIPARQQAADSGVPVLLWLRSFAGVPQKVSEARHWVESLLPPCGPRDDLAMITGEFCANTVEHTRSGQPGGQFAVHLAWSPSAARITVGDEGSAEAPAIVAATLQTEHGRGLDIVDCLASRWGFTGDGTQRLLWADVPWQSQGGPQRIDRTDAMPTAEAVRKLGLACPGIQIGYNGDPPAWWVLLPGDSYPEDRLAAPCFGALTQITTASWMTRRPSDPRAARPALMPATRDPRHS